MYIITLISEEGLDALELKTSKVSTHFRDKRERIFFCQIPTTAIQCFKCKQNIVAQEI